MRCKKELMGLAALMVLLFHFYIPFGTSMVETYIFRSTFIGVDLFFFVSAYSLGSRNREGKFQYGKFLLNRISYIYIPFVVLTIISAIYRKWPLMQFTNVINGREFFEKSGGAFLWYFVGIMMIYICSPLFVFSKQKLKMLGFPVLIGFWLLLSVLLQFALGYTKLFILINRLPIFIIGLYYDELVARYIKKLKLWIVIAIEVALFIIGTVLTYKYAVATRLLKPFADMYYVVAIPLVIATVMIMDTVVTKIEPYYKSKILKFLGTITLEVYGLQMIFGYDIEMAILKQLPKEKPIMQLAFFLTVLCLIAMAFVFNLIFGYMRRNIGKICCKKER